MSDEELTNLLIDRHRRLSEEANAALTEVLQGKDPAAFTRELNEKVEDLNAQARAATEEAARYAAHNKRARRVMLIFFAAVAAVHVVAWMLRQE
jgi:hypothetical protein